MGLQLANAVAQQAHIFDEARDFKTLLAADPDIGRTLSGAALDHAFDLAAHLKHADTIFARVFSA